MILNTTIIILMVFYLPFIKAGMGDTHSTTLYERVSSDNISGLYCEHIEVNTPDNLEYKLYPAPDGIFKFKVRAANDAHIALCSENGETGPMFEVVIGGWSNSKSVIRKNKKQPDLVEVRIANILHPGEFRGFWICWRDSVITVGKEGESDAFLTWKDRDFMPINYVGVHTGFGAIGTWLIDKEVNTPDNLEYKLYPAPDGIFKFKVRAANDAHIALCSENGETGPMFEVVIGGWSNSKSVIRKNKKQPDLVEVRIANILHPSEFRGFWICWRDSVITVGKEGEDDAFLTWKDRDLMPINYVGVHTGFGAIGTWLIDKEVNTPDNLEYKLYPAPDGIFKFKVRAANDAHIALCSENGETGPMFEVVIGGWSNSKSVIRKNKKQPDLVEVRIANILHPSEFRGFWICWRDSVITVGKEGEDDAFLTWKDRDLMPKVNTPDNLEYKLYPAPDGIFKFKVRAANDAHIALCSENGETGPMFEVVIGGWSNSKSVIRKNKKQPDLVEVRIANILHPSEFRGFWICWRDSVITVGKEGEDDAFLTWKDRDLMPINYVGVHTGFGAIGTWLIDKEVNTPDNLEYKLYPAPDGIFKFKVRAANDAHIALCSENGETGPMFEVVIGGWSNSKSVIRKNKKQPDLVEVRIANILHPSEFRGFWICWRDSVITVGKEGEDDAFLTWKDRDFMPINYVGVHTGFGAIGTWLIDKEVNTPDNLEYKLYPAPDGIFKFKVRAANDAHIALCSENGETGPMFEVVIGGWSNSKSVIRKNKKQPDLVEVRIANILHPGEFRGFWICWRDSVITVGKEGESDVFLTWKDRDFMPINYVGVHTGFGAIGTWLIDKEVNTPDNLEYKLYPAPDGIFKFKVRAANDAHIALCSENGETGPMFEVVIGGWSNSKSVIRKNKKQPDLVEVRIANILHPSEFRGFWICWRDSVITVGKEGEDDAFLTWKDRDFMAINYVGVHTGFGAIGTWLIDKEVNTPDNLEYKLYPAPDGIFKFKVRAANDAHIALCSENGETGPMFEVVIGGWSNSKSVIRKNKKQPDLVEVRIANILHPSEFRGFWICWRDSVITVGKEGEDDAFLTWKDRDFMPINYVGVHTGFGAIGTWLIDKGCII